METAIMRFSLALAAAALAGLSAPAFAHDRHWNGSGGGYGYQDVRGYDRGYARNPYPRGGYYAPARGYPQRGWQGGGYDPRFGGQGYYDPRFDRCRGNSGVTGALLGGVLGGVIGDQVAQRGDKTMGTVIGAGLGGVLGATIERSGRDRRCG
jgi:hypothetical protein